MTLLERLIRMPRDERTRPLPAETLAMVVEAEAALAAGMQPASLDEVREVMVSLLSHYPSRRMSAPERASVAGDWLVDLSKVPADIIAAACQEWRRGTNTYAPNPGQLLALITPVVEARRLRRRIAADWLAAQRAQTPLMQRKAEA